MKNNVTDPDDLRIILTNIRQLRTNKNISSKAMAYSIGIKPTEYSKLENGHKLNLEKWLAKIAKVLELESLDILFHNNARDYKPELKDSELIKILMEQKVVEHRLFKIIESDKDKLIEAFISNAEHWKAKYYRQKTQLKTAEQKIAVYMNQIACFENKGTIENISGAINVGGGVINYQTKN